MKNTIGYMRLRIASISKLAAATTLSLGLIACGGEREQQAPQDNEARVTVQGADGASVSYARSTGDHAKITVRVARDASGAQPLPQDLKPLSSIYQFTPLGMAATDIEIRLPFSASATGQGAPGLWVTVPGEGWTQLLDARVEGSWMVARAPRMAHAVVAMSPMQASSFKPSSFGHVGFDQPHLREGIIRCHHHRTGPAWRTVDVGCKPWRHTVVPGPSQAHSIWPRWR